MKEIFIIKDCFELYNDINDFFSKKGKEIKSIDFDEISEIKSSQSTVIIDKKFEEKQGGQSNILKIARNIGSTKLIVLDSTNDGSYDLKKEMGGAYIQISFKIMDEAIKEGFYPRFVLRGQKFAPVDGITLEEVLDPKKLDEYIRNGSSLDNVNNNPKIK